MTADKPTPTPSTPNTPNLYALRGGQIHVTYTTTSIDGTPHFTYQDAHQSLSFKGDQIRTAASELGTLVSVVIIKTIDMGSTSFTLLLPRVNLDSTNTAHIATEGITTIHRFSVIPAFSHGQRDFYTVTALSGDAKLVMF